MAGLSLSLVQKTHIVFALTLEWLAFILGLGDGELELVDDGVLPTFSIMISSLSVGDDASVVASEGGKAEN